MATVLLGIGSNLGDREAHIERAMSLLKENEDIEIISVSSLIETDPEGACLPDRQGLPQDKFLNGTVKIETDLLPLELLSQLKMVERRLGRVKSAGPNRPRTLDLDILFYDDVVIMEGKNLTIPHPKLTQRMFVLEPLLQIAPDFIHPRLRKTVKELYHELYENNKRPANAPQNFKPL